jgi:hypothetical protein
VKFLLSSRLTGRLRTGGYWLGCVAIACCSARAGHSVFFLKLRFGFPVLKNFGFLDIRNQSVFLKMKNREVRFRFFTLVFR